MNILFFSHYFPPEGNAPASRTYDNCKRWAANGHTVRVLTCAPNVPDGKIYEGYQNRWHQVENMDGVEVHRVWTFLAPNKGAFRRVLNYLSYLLSALLRGLLLPKPDVVVCTSPQFFCGIAGVLLGKMRRVPVILEIRDIWPESIEAVGAMKKSFLTRTLERMERWMYRKALHIVTVGDGYKGKLLERGVPPEKIDVIPNGADLVFFRPLPPNREIADRWGTRDKFSLAYVGTIGMASGLHVVLETARKIKDLGDDSIRFLLVGDGARRQELQEQAENQELDSVVFTGRLPKQEIPSLLNTVDVCLIHLEKSDLFKTVLPSKMFEAFACAKPVLLGVDGNAREVLDSADAGLFFEPENADALYESARTLRNDQEMRARLGENGLRHVREYYDRDVLAARFESLLLKLIPQKTSL